MHEDTLMYHTASLGCMRVMVHDAVLTAQWLHKLSQVVMHRNSTAHIRLVTAANLSPTTLH